MKMTNSLNHKSPFMMVCLASSFFFFFISSDVAEAQLFFFQSDQQTGHEKGHVEQSQRDDKGQVYMTSKENPPSQCTTGDPIYPMGTCVPSIICTDTGGIPSGSCAQGLGVCCIVTKSCNSETNFNNTYFVNPDHIYEGGACSLTVNRASSNICQIRLDFQSLTISQPDNDGNCNEDFLTVTGGNTPSPIICGHNAGQHMYVEVEPAGGPIKINLDLFVLTTITREWNIEVSQISCDSSNRAPDGCIQYFTSTSGIVQSFNYGTTVSEIGTRQIHNMNYGVCIKQASGYCGIIWERDPSSQFSFTVSENVCVVNPILIGTPDTSSTGAIQCPNDYVIIPEGVDDLGAQADRYCGLGFPNEVTSTAMPFVLYVKTNKDELADGANRGFSLVYRQISSCN